MERVKDMSFDWSPVLARTPRWLGGGSFGMGGSDPVGSELRGSVDSRFAKEKE